MDEKLVLEYLERGVSAIERLAQDPEIRVDTGPPVCPHCRRDNPTVRIEESEGTGALAEFVIRAACLHCGQLFYAVPYQWATAKTVPETEQLVTERAELSGYDRREN
jgi:hypothetical protein